MNSRHKILMLCIKYLPFIIAGISFIGTLFATFGIDLIFLSFIGYASILDIIFMLVLSFGFQFCIWHRLPIYYILGMNLVNFTCYKFNIITVSSTFTVINILLFCILMFLSAYLKNKCNE